MDAPRTAAVMVALLALSASPWIAGSQDGSSSPPSYRPKAQRLEVLEGWEKRPGAQAPPEIVAGVYERDYLRYDFRNKVAITIDDAGPNKYLAMELDALKDYGVTATFFIIGSYFLDKRGRPMPRAKELLQRIVDEGHEIGSHSFHHERLDLPPYRDDRAAIDEELDRNQRTIDLVLGYHYPIRYFRPPNGAHSTPLYTLDRALLARGQYLANWTITSFDWNMRYKEGNPERLGPDQVIARSLKQAKEESGGVLLFHGFPESAELLDDLLAALGGARNRGGDLEFSTLDEVMRCKYGDQGR